MPIKDYLLIARANLTDHPERAQAAALIAIVEQAKRIADALNSIDIALTNASGADGAIKVTQ